MSKEAFFESVRAAYRLAIPHVALNGKPTDSAAVERTLHRGDWWLTRKAVDGYEPSDFADLPVDVQAELAGAVRLLVQIADASPVQNVDPAQRATAWTAFDAILRIVRSQVIAEWVAAVDGLYREIEDLTNGQGDLLERPGLATRRYPKQMTDLFLGTYDLAQLLIQTPEARFILDPVARYAGDTSGVMDLYVYPSLEGVTLSRKDGDWRIHANRPGRPAQPWSVEAFRATLESLTGATV
jgi:hypothetical protein